MCEFVTRDMRIAIENLMEIKSIIKMFWDKKIDGFSVEKTDTVFLNVCWNSRHMVIIFHDYSNYHIDPKCYRMLNASVDAVESREIVKFIVSQQPSFIPKNMCLSRKLGIRVITDFCRSDKLSSSVHWLKDNPRTE